ncbi:hypothetical protein BU17DRAFT_101519 [Hysterangium stoloniferum]|nr:hypothetical protein BU17DRAFT_101519 [Hysterangium stoloniferum]
MPQSCSILRRLYPEEPSQLLSSTQSKSQPPEEVTCLAHQLTRRATSQTPATVPTPTLVSAPEVEAASTAMEVDVRVVVKPETSESQATKMPCKNRRGGLINTLLGLDDGDTSMTAPSSAQAEEVREKSVPVPPTQEVAHPASNDDEENCFGIQPLKKFKALFKESGHAQMSRMEEEKEEGRGRVPKPQAQAQKRKANAVDIDEAPSQAEAVEHAVEGSIEVGHSQEPKTIGVDDSHQVVAEDKGKGKSKVPRLTPASTTKKFQPLFDLDSKEEEIEAAVASALLADMADTTQDMDLTLGTNLPSQVMTRRGTKWKVMATIQESDSGDEDGMTFGGFSKQPMKRRK